jgi:phenylalanyl-tRNA synthetase beta subunit
VVCGIRDTVGEIEKLLQDIGGPDVLSLQFLRTYSLSEKEQSVSFRLVVGAPDRTLTSEEVTAVRNRVIATVRKLGYDVRV